MARRPMFGPALPPAMAKARRKAKRVAKALTKNQKAAVRKIVAAPMETKYVADVAKTLNGLISVIGYTIPQSIVSGGPTTNTAFGLIPALTQGTDGHQRLGNKISNVTLKSDFQFWINAGLTNFPTVDATVKLFILKAKPVKALSQVGNLPVGALLDNGDGTSIDWTATAPVADKFLATYPVNKEIFTVCSVRSFRLVKNQDSATGGVNPTGGASPNMERNQAHTYSYTHKHKGNVVYPDNNIVGFALPENLNLFAYWVVYDTNAYTPLPANCILGSVRSHMWYKDS